MANYLMAADVQAASETSEIYELSIFTAGAFAASILAQSDTRRGRLTVAAEIVQTNFAAVALSNAVTTISLPFSVPESDNRVLLAVACEWRTNYEMPNVLAATFGGTTMTPLVSATTTSQSRFYNCTIFRAIAPPTILADIVVSTVDASNFNDVVLYGLSLANVNQTTPGAGTGTDMAGPWSAGFSISNPGAWLVGGVFAYGGDVTFTPSGDTEIIDQRATGTSTIADISAALLKLAATIIDAYAVEVSGDNDTKGVLAVAEVQRAPIESLINFLTRMTPASQVAAISMPVQRDLAATVSAATTTSVAQIDGSVTFGAGSVASSDAGIPALLVQRDLETATQIGSLTGIVKLARIVAFFASASTQSASGNAGLAVLRMITSPIVAGSGTATMQLFVKASLFSIATPASTTSLASLSRLIAFSAGATGGSDTSLTNLGVFTSFVFSALIQPACVVSAPSVTVEREINAVSMAGSATPAAGLAVRVPFGTAMAVQSSTVANLIVDRAISAALLFQSASSSPALSLALMLASSAQPATVTAVGILGIMRAVSANAVANCATGAPAITVARQLAGSVDAISETATPIWLSFVYLAALAQAQSDTADSALFRFLIAKHVVPITATVLQAGIEATGLGATITAVGYSPVIKASTKRW